MASDTAYSKPKPGYGPKLRGNGTEAEVRLPQALAFDLAKVRLGGHGYAVLLAVIAITHQFHRDRAAAKEISYAEFERLTGLHQQLVRRALVELEARSVISTVRGAGQRPSTYQLRPTTEWLDAASAHNGVSARRAAVTGRATHNGVSKTTHNGVSAMDGQHSQRGEDSTHNRVSAMNPSKHSSSTDDQALQAANSLANGASSEKGRDVTPTDAARTDPCIQAMSSREIADLMSEETNIVPFLETSPPSNPRGVSDALAFAVDERIETPRDGPGTVVYADKNQVGVRLDRDGRRYDFDPTTLKRLGDVLAAKSS